MNYFEFYQLPITFKLNKDQVKQKYYALSKEFHPDFYIHETEGKQAEVLELSTLNTNAFNTLMDDKKCIQYILQLYDKLEEANHEKLPQDFLMQMMDINESIAEFDGTNNDEQQKILLEIDVFLKDISLEIKDFPTDLGVVSEEEQQNWLTKLKKYHQKYKYLHRIKQRALAIT